MSEDITYYDSKENVEYALMRNPDGYIVRRRVSPYGEFSETIIGDRTNSTFIIETSSSNVNDDDFIILDDLVLTYELDSETGNTYVMDSYEFSIVDGIDTIPNQQYYRELITLPYPKEMCLVPINEYMTKPMIDGLTEHLFDNFTYLVDKCNYAALSPTHVMYRYGPTIISNNNSWVKFDYSHLHWITYDNALSGENDGSSFGGLGVAAYDDVLYYFDVEKQAIIASYQTDTLPNNTIGYGYSTEETDRDFYYYINDKFNNISRILPTETGELTILDKTDENSGKISQFTFDMNSKSWAVLGVISESPADFGDIFTSILDIALYNNNIYVLLSDGNNTYLGKTTLTGEVDVSKIQTKYPLTKITISHDKILSFYQNKMILWDVSDFSFVIEYDFNGQIKKYNPETLKYEPSTILGISASKESGYCYLYSENILYKATIGGVINDDFGEFAVSVYNELGQDNYNGSFSDKLIKDVYQDEKYIVYVSTDYDIIGYYDRSITEGNILSDDFKSNIKKYIWDLKNLKVNKDESDSYIAYNRIFGRLYDNIHALNENIVAVIGIEIGKDVYNKIASFPLSPLDIKELPYAKEEIRIGINEMHFEASINRCIQMLYDCLEVVAKRINSRKNILGIESFELNSFMVSNADIIIEDDNFYYEKGYSPASLNFEWSDNIPNRKDGWLTGEFEYFDKTGTKYSVPLSSPSGVPLSYTLDLSTETEPRTGKYTFGIKEIYSSELKIKYLDIYWEKKIFIGSNATGTVFTCSESACSVSACEMLNSDNLQEFLISTEINKAVGININGTINEFFIAVPCDELDSGKLRIVNPNYPDFEYIFNGDSKIKIEDFTCNGFNRGDYYILTCPRYNPSIGKLYNDNVSMLEYAIIRKGD